VPLSICVFCCCSLRPTHTALLLRRLRGGACMHTLGGLISIRSPLCRFNSMK
jgi:hypothetical protein